MSPNTRAKLRDAAERLFWTFVAAFLGQLLGGTGWVSISSTSGDVVVQWSANNTGAGTGITRHANSRIVHRIP